MRFDDAFKALVEFAASRHNAFHTTEAAGMTTARLRRGERQGDFTRLHRSVWAITSLGRPAGQTLRAATLAIAQGAIAQQSSCWVHGWTDDPPPRNHLWMPARGRRPLDGVTAMWASLIDPEQDIVEVRGIRTLNKAATLCLLGRSADDRVVSRMLDEFLRHDSMTWLEQTLARLHRPNDAGTARLTRLLNDTTRVNGITESPMERILADLLTDAHITGLVAQHPVRVQGRTYRLDLAIPAIKLGIEAHSRTFHWGHERRESDNERDLHLGSAGWKLIYVTWNQIQEPDRLAAAIAEIVAIRRAQLLPAA